MTFPESSTSKKECLTIEVKGFVQGLGFRPFVYRLAKLHQQNGWVSNTNMGVSITVEGAALQQQQFLFDLQNQLPPFAEIQSLSIQQKKLENFDSFQINISSTDGKHSAFVLPDISPCPDCISDIFNPQSRFYRYPFTSCCFCGPRYSIMTQQPYDRIRTSMAEFTVCSECQLDYSSPENRRFHSQTIACPNCGPQLSLLDNDGNSLFQYEQALSKAIEFLKQGKIIATKGVGGFQLVTDATNSQAVEELRLRKQRPAKPFALMVENLASAKKLCQINKTEERALISHASPIVLLKCLNFTYVADAVAPNNTSLGIMLPASPLHHLLVHDFGNPLITTSGNRMNDPICVTDQQALDRLGDIADFFLTHDRAIIRPLDDSIIRSINNKPVVLRRARGYTPSPVTISESFPDTLALGGHMKNTVAINQGNQLILSQHIGDLDSANSQQQYQQTIADLQTFYSTMPSSVVHDLHPDYHSSIVASQLGKNKILVQQHHAHILSCMAEHDLQAPVLGIAWDGTGLGTENTLWGGECLLLTSQTFKRYAHFRSFPLLGGDKAVKEPGRCALGLLYEVFLDECFENKNLDFLSAFTDQELNLLKQSLTKQLNTPYTSSVGRLFDAVSSLLGLCHINQFEGQAAMLLEQRASTIHTNECYPFKLMEGECIIIDWYSTIKTLLIDINKKNRNLIAAKFHNTLAEIMVEIAKRSQQKNIVLSGGCFQNAYLTERCAEKLKTAGFTVYTHEKIPPNDGGLALGQLYTLTM